MKVDGVRPTEKFYMALLRATGEGGRTDKTVEILDEMKEIGLKPGVRSYNCAVGACGKVFVVFPFNTVLHLTCQVLSTSKRDRVQSYSSVEPRGI